MPTNDLPDPLPDPPHLREDYREVWLSGYRAGREAGQRMRPPEQLTEFEDAIRAGWQVYDDPAKIAARYRDRDLADTVPRCIIYLDIGMLLGLLLRDQ